MVKLYDEIIGALTNYVTEYHPSLVQFPTL